MAIAAATHATTLANAVFAALSSRHARFAEHEGRAMRYAAEVAPFAGLPADATESDWDDLAALVHRTGNLSLHREPGALPEGWAARHGIAVRPITVLQFTGAGLRAEAADPEVRPLTGADVAAMRALTEQTAPGPFGPRTIELGGYVGIWRDGRLAAMAGHRFSLPGNDNRGWTEVSAVCTDPALRGQGLATRLIRAVAAEIRARGDEIFLHVLASNHGAVALYERLGFTRSNTVEITRCAVAPA